MSEVKQKPSVGRIVIFHPNGDNSYPLPNQMEIAPAIITQVFESESGVSLINANLFVSNPGGEPSFQLWSIRPKDEAIDGIAYWDWPERV